MTASSNRYENGTIYSDVCVEIPTGTRGWGGHPSCPTVPTTFPNLAWLKGRAGGDLGGNTVVLEFGRGFAFKRSYIRLDGFLQSCGAHVPRDPRAGPSGAQRTRLRLY